MGAATRYYVYTGDDILAEYASGWTTASASYTQGLGTDEPFLRVEDGAVPAPQRFDAWGNVATASGAAISQYGYTGREPDATGLMYYRARYYIKVPTMTSLYFMAGFGDLPQIY